ncbi:NAD(P)/FAD-dependent oxidoreductase [Pseudonocardia acidicola]|uniref:NAD(P)-binding protein n=1 Tax=Pseudonocardia acidicola TaxID=2724939 RepID=A0ABX1SG93_9PSEU|nr:FAD-dependent oxidoreductase [Pseudonocardia acidicola]NMI00581.1 NAD(P)-binding protein [Pseudonocardia acidicola]
MSVVVVGAGLAGVACAVELAAAGVPVRVLDRAHTVGGRMATAMMEGRAVDYGAAYFTVRDPEFAEVVARWRTAGLARPWTCELAVLGPEGRGRSPGPMRWATPHGLRSLVADLADGLDVELGHEVRHVGPGPVIDGRSVDVVVLAMPDPQARQLLDLNSGAAAAVTGRAWRPVLAVTARFPAREWGELPAAFVNDHPVLSLIADDGDRRGDGAPVLVAHTTGEVARRHLADPDRAVPEVVAAMRELLDLHRRPVWTRTHRWTFAAPESDRDRPFLLTTDGIGLAGDSWGSSRIETAWRSGTLLGREVARRRVAG